MNSFRKVTMKLQPMAFSRRCYYLRTLYFICLFLLSWIHPGSTSLPWINSNCACKDPDLCTIKAYDYLCPRLPINPTQHYPTKASLYNATMRYHTDSAGECRAQLLLGIVPPRDGSVNQLSGFDVHLIGSSSRTLGRRACVRISLDSTAEPTTVRNMLFFVDCFTNLPAGAYALVIYTLPTVDPGSQSHRETIFVPTAFHENGICKVPTTTPTPATTTTSSASTTTTAAKSTQRTEPMSLKEAQTESHPKDFSVVVSFLGLLAVLVLIGLCIRKQFRSLGEKLMDCFQCEKLMDCFQCDDNLNHSNHNSRPTGNSRQQYSHDGDGEHGEQGDKLVGDNTSEASRTLANYTV